MDVDEVVDGFVAHASGRIVRMASAQGHFDLLRRGSGDQKGQHVAAQSGRVGHFVALGAFGPPARTRLRIHAAVALAPTVTGDLAEASRPSSAAICAPVLPWAKPALIVSRSLALRRRREFTTKPKRPLCVHAASTELFPAVLPRACPKLAASFLLRPSATPIPPTINPNITRIAFIIVHQEKGNHSLSACAPGVRLRLQTSTIINRSHAR